MRKGVVTLPQGESVASAAKVLKKNNIGSVIVLHKNEPVGILTERDCVFKVIASGKDPKKVKLKEVMSSPLKAVGPEVDVEEAARMLRDEKIKRLPVVNDKGRLIGILSETDMTKVSPALFDIIRERAEIGHYPLAGTFTGVCEGCGNYSEDLENSNGKMLCEECRGE